MCGEEPLGFCGEDPLEFRLPSASDDAEAGSLLACAKPAPSTDAASDRKKEPVRSFECSDAAVPSSVNRQSPPRDEFCTLLAPPVESLWEEDSISFVKNVARVSLCSA